MFASQMYVDMLISQFIQPHQTVTGTIYIVGELIQYDEIFLNFSKLIEMFNVLD